MRKRTRRKIQQEAGGSTQRGWKSMSFRRMAGSFLAMALAALSVIVVGVIAGAPEAVAATSPESATGLIYVCSSAAACASNPPSGAICAGTAFVMQSANQSVVATAGHGPTCNGQISPSTAYFVFYPEWSNSAQPLGAFRAGPSDVHMDGRYLQGDVAYDFAFIVVGRNSSNTTVGAAVGGGLPVTWNPPYNGQVTVYGYPGGTVLLQCGPGSSSTYTGPSWQSGDPQDMKLQNNCNFGGGASGGPWIDSSGSVVALTSQQISDCGIFCGTYNTGAYMGASAEAQFDAAQAVSIQPPPPVTSAYKYAMIDSEDEYSGPSESTSVLQALPKGTAVYLTCQQAGADVEGSAVWDRLTNGGWVPDYYVNTQNVGTFSYPIPTCISPKATTYHVYGTSSLAERSGPSNSDSAVGTLARGAAVPVVCQTNGPEVGKSTVWDYQLNHSYVPDYYVNSPGDDTYSPGIPRCPAVVAA